MCIEKELERASAGDLSGGGQAEEETERTGKRSKEDPRLYSFIL